MIPLQSATVEVQFLERREALPDILFIVHDFLAELNPRVSLEAAVDGPDAEAKGGLHTAAAE
jgi:hypothetical protein